MPPIGVSGRGESGRTGGDLYGSSPILGTGAGTKTIRGTAARQHHASLEYEARTGNNRDAGSSE